MCLKLKEASFFLSLIKVCYTNLITIWIPYASKIRRSMFFLYKLIAVIQILLRYGFPMLLKLEAASFSHSQLYNFH